MSDEQRTTEQLIHELEMLSAYRQGIVEAQLGIAGNGISSILDCWPSSQHWDPYMPQATTPQDPLASQLQLLIRNNQRLAALQRVTAASQSDLANSIFRALGPSMDSTHSSLLSPVSSILNEQSQLGSLTQSRSTNSLLPSSFNLMKSSFDPSSNDNEVDQSQNSFRTSLTEASTTAYDRTLANSTTSSSSIHTTARSKVPTARREKKVEERKPKKPFKKSIAKHKKNVVRKASLHAPSARSRTHSIHEDARLLLETAATLASVQKKVSLGDKDTVHVSPDSKSRYEHLVKDSELTCIDLWDTVPDYLFISMAQMRLTRLKPQGQFVNLKTTTELAYAGLCCKHCETLLGFGSHFFKCLVRGSHCHRIVKHVQSECSSCPTKVREKVENISIPKSSELLAKMQVDSDGPSASFFDYIWNRLDMAGFLEDDSSNTSDLKNEGNASDVVIVDV
jgi:hypothetical protein